MAHVVGLPMGGQGVVVEKPEPFTPRDDKTGALGSRSFYGIKLGFVGGYVKLAVDQSQFEALQIGQEIKIKAAVSTEAGKTKFTLLDYVPANKA